MEPDSPALAPGTLVAGKLRVRRCPVSCWKRASTKREQMLGNCATTTAMGNAEACNAEVNDAQDRLNSASARDAIGYIGIGVGGAALGLGLYWLLTGDDPQRYDRKPVANEVARSLVPAFSVAPRGATLSVEGRF